MNLKLYIIIAAIVAILGGGGLYENNASKSGKIRGEVYKVYH